MRYFKINDTDSVIAESKDAALSKFKELFGIKIDSNYTSKEFEDEFDINVTEQDINIAKVLDGDPADNKRELITVAEFIKRYPDLENPHFTNEF